MTLFSSGRYLYILFIRGIVYSELLLHVVAFLALPSFIVVIISVALTLLFGHASDFYTNCCIACGSNEICCILILTSTYKYRVHTYTGTHSFNSGKIILRQEIPDFALQLVKSLFILRCFISKSLT